MITSYFTSESRLEQKTPGVKKIQKNPNPDSREFLEKLKINDTIK